MATYNPLTAKLVKEVKTIVGAKNMTIDPDRMDLIRAIKKALDPNVILNPGKIFTADGNEMELLNKTEGDFR